MYLLASYRSRFDIIADILKVVKDNGAKKTQIMYGANLSYQVLKRYLSLISEASLVRFENRRRCYMLTERGRIFLERYREYHMRSRHLKRQMQSVHANRKVLEELCSA